MAATMCPTVSLASIDFLTHVITARIAVFCGFDRLAVDDPGARCNLAPVLLAREDPDDLVLRET